MPNYQRDRTPGGTYFFTVNLRNRRESLLVERIGLLRDCFARERSARPFSVVAWVVLPDHMHWLWHLPAGDSDYPTRWRRIKTGFSKALGRDDAWQPRYWEHRIRDARDLHRHVDYIHLNPAKHDHVTKPGQWPHSSFHEYVKRGVYAPDWHGAA